MQASPRPVAASRHQRPRLDPEKSQPGLRCCCGWVRRKGRPDGVARMTQWSSHLYPGLFESWQNLCRTVERHWIWPQRLRGISAGSPTNLGVPWRLCTWLSLGISAPCGGSEHLPHGAVSWGSERLQLVEWDVCHVRERPVRERNANSKMCCRFANSWALHSISGVFSQPLAVHEAENTPSCGIWVILSAAGALVCCGTSGCLFLCFDPSLIIQTLFLT